MQRAHGAAVLPPPPNEFGPGLMLLWDMVEAVNGGDIRVSVCMLLSAVRGRCPDCCWCDGWGSRYSYGARSVFCLLAELLLQTLVSIPFKSEPSGNDDARRCLRLLVAVILFLFLLTLLPVLVPVTLTGVW